MTRLSRKTRFNKSSYSTLLIAVACFLILPTCSDLTDSVVKNEESLRSQVSGVDSGEKLDPVVRWAEGHFIDLAEQIPGFAGYYLTEDEEKIITLVKEGETGNPVRQRIANYVNANISSNRIFSTDKIRIEEAKYSYNELNEWRGKIRKTVMDLPGVVFLDLDERLNRLTIGVSSDSYTQSIESQLSSFQVPSEAINFEVTQIRISGDRNREAVKTNFYSHKDIRDKFRPVIGGIALNICTLGMVANWGGQEVFITNSHCTDEIASLDSNPEKYYQPDYDPLVGDNNYIGEEIYDVSAPRYSDAALMKFDNDESGKYGEIARTTGRTWQWQISGSIDISHETETFEIVKDNRAAVINMPVYKTGKTTGSTGGYVAKTCIDITNWASTGTLYCQFVADPLYNQPGDSGSPVMYDGGLADIEDGEVELMGILWGIYGPDENGLEAGIYSPISGVKTDLGSTNNPLFTYAKIDVAISGPSFIDEDGSYNWDAVIHNETGTVGYQWSIKWSGSSSWNTLGTGSSQSVNVTSDTDFTLKLVATDDISQGEVTSLVVVEIDCDPANPCN